MAALTNCLGDMKVVDWREFRRMEELNSSLLLVRNFDIRKRSFSLFYPLALFNPYPTAFPYGNGMVLHFYQQQESSTTKTVHKVINKGLKTYV